MNKHLQNSKLYFRTVLFREEELLPVADFKILNKYILSELAQETRIFTAAVRLPREITIKPLEHQQVIFRLDDLPPKKQREAAAILLAKFPYLSPRIFTAILGSKDSYIELVCTKYPRQTYKISIALVRLIDAKEDARQREEKLAEKRRDEKKYNPSSGVRRLRAKLLKTNSDYAALDLVEKYNEQY